MATPAEHYLRAEELTEEAEDLVAKVRRENAKVEDYDSEKLFDAAALATLLTEVGQLHATLATCMPHTHEVR